MDVGCGVQCVKSASVAGKPSHRSPRVVRWVNRGQSGCILKPQKSRGETVLVLMNDSVKPCGCLKDRTIPKSRDVYCDQLEDEDDDD